MKFYRVQPNGKQLFGHRSKLADVPVAGIFAYKNPETLFDNYTWLHFRKRLKEYEMVEFDGVVVDAPEDSEGVVVAPKRELKRTPMLKWLEQHGYVYK